MGRWGHAPSTRILASVNRKTLAGTVGAAFLLAGCMTGPRPRLVDDLTAAPLTNTNAQGLVDALSTQPRQPYTVAYEILTKFGGRTTKALVTGDAVHGTVVIIGETTYGFFPDGRQVTCSDDTCVDGIDETRISDRQLTARFYKDSAISRVRQDARVALGEITFAIEDVAGTSALCIDVPVIDGNGAPQTKSYCAFSTFGLLASMDTADLLITATSVASSVDLSKFEALPL